MTTAAGEWGRPGGDAGHKALGRTSQPKEALSAAPQRGEALLCHRVRSGGGLTFSPCPSPWHILATQEGEESRQGHWPLHGTPAVLYMTGWKETPGKLENYKTFAF